MFLKNKLKDDDNVRYFCFQDESNKTNETPFSLVVCQWRITFIQCNFVTLDCLFHIFFFINRKFYS